MIEHLWHAPARPLALTHEQIHIWAAQLDQPAAMQQRLATTLSPDEQARAARFYFERDRNHFTVARAILRLLLGRYLSVEPSRLTFSYGPYGKPALIESYEMPELRFNVAHSHGLALYGFARGRELGVDVEGIRPLDDAESIAERFFSRRESSLFRELPVDLKPQGFFNCWTRKEAYLKATGDGLAQPLDSFEVSLAPGEPAQLLSIGGDPNAAAAWSMQSLLPAPGFAGACVAQGHSWELQCYAWHTDG